MRTASITGTGTFVPSQVVSNEELVASFNAYVAEWNRTHANEIAGGQAVALEPSSAEFVLKASGIQRRHVVDREGILDPSLLRPRIANRSNDEPSIQCEMALKAAGDALENAKVAPQTVDAVILGCSNPQRAYPAVAVEVQHRLGATGLAFDMNVACSSATFAISIAKDMVQQGTAKRVLVVNPEICTAHLNFRDRESHFIFGDACTAVVVEDLEATRGTEVYEILGTRLLTSFSNAIRNNAGFLDRCMPEHRDDVDRLFVQQGRKVFKDVLPMVAGLISGHLDELGIAPHALRRLWLHQANKTMNQWIAAKVLGRDATEDEAPNVLGEYGNTSSCGSILAFHDHRRDIQPGDVGLICSFGAGYSAGNVVVRKVRR